MEDIDKLEEDVKVNKRSQRAEDKPQAANPTRKVEFDKGVPLTFDFASNEVETLRYEVVF